MKINIVYRGDCRDALQAKIPKESINLIFADPPYNLSGNGLNLEKNKTGGAFYMVNEEWDKMTPEEYSKFTLDWISECKRVLKENGSIYISCTFHNLGEVLVTLKKLNFKILNVITWFKKNAMPSITKRTFTHSCEYVVWASKGKNWVFNYEDIKKINPHRTFDNQLKQMRDFFDYIELPVVQGKERVRDKSNRALHPTQKPEKLLEIIIMASSNKGDIVLDPFLGSGTTAVVADRLGRKWIGIEKEKKYVTMAKERIERARKKIQLL